MTTKNIFDFLRSQKQITVLLVVTTIMWAVGLPMWINMASAADITSFSDTLSDSDTSVVSNHEIEFTMSSTGQLTAGETLTVTFQTGFNLGSVAFGDIDLSVGGSDQTLAASAASGVWGVGVSGQTITFTSNDTTISSNDTVVIKIGTNASGGSNQITNPTAGSYTVDIGGTMDDSGTTRVAIIDDVSVTASVDTTFTFSISGVSSGTGAITSEQVTDITTTATSIPFGTLSSGTAKAAAQQLTVSTNAVNGFSVTVQQDQNLTSASTADIDVFVDGDATSTPVSWRAPSATVGSEATYGHYGITSEDSSLSGGDDFGDALYSGQFTSSNPLEVFYNNGVANGTTTYVGIKIETSALQEAANDYSNTLTYIATPVF